MDGGRGSLARRDHGTRRVVTDHLGTPRLLCDRCAERVAYHELLPYGEDAPRSTDDGLRIRFTGHERDLNLPTKTTDDLDYMHARHYSFWTGRFLSVDPVQSGWSRYAYVSGNPVNLVDPWGLMECRFENGELQCSDTATVIGTDPAREHDERMLLELLWASAENERRMGIMARLAEQPRVPDSTELILETMASYQCTATWDMVWENMRVTNSLGLPAGGAGFKLFGLRGVAVRIASQATGTSVPAELGFPTFGQLIAGGFRGMVVNGVRLSATEAVGWTVAGSLPEFVFTWSAWQAGVFTGSFVNTLLTAPCGYNH